MCDLGALRKAIRPNTRLVWMETPSNPLMNVVDIAAVAEIAHGAGAQLVVDGTFGTPILQRPLELGADVVLHSSTKYLGGHSDVQGGALVFARRDATVEQIAHIRHVLGAVASPFGCWLVLRGLRTLACRMERHSANAQAIAQALAGHPALDAVLYPGLPSHPGHEVARRQMKSFGGMLSLRVKGGRAKALDVASRVKLFVNATSLGGVESLLEHRASSEGHGQQDAGGSAAVVRRTRASRRPDRGPLAGTGSQPIAGHRRKHENRSRLDDRGGPILPLGPGRPARGRA